MFVRRRARHHYDRFRAGDPMTQLIAIIALVLLGIIALPRLTAFLPYQASGVDCLDLAAPKLTGNNQSILASEADPELLHLELVPIVISINQGEALAMDVRFINEGMAPVRLFLVPDEILF